MSRNREATRGTALLEMILTLPVLLAALLILVQIGRNSQRLVSTAGDQLLAPLVRSQTEQRP